MEALAAVDQRKIHQNVEEPAVDAVVHAQNGARLDIFNTLRHNHINEQTHHHEGEPEGEVGGAGGEAAGGAVDGGFAEPHKGEHGRHADNAQQRAQQGEQPEAGADSPKIAEIWSDAFQGGEGG